MAQAAQGFNEQLERVGQVAVVVAALLTFDLLTWRVLWLPGLLFLVIRPLSFAIGLAGAAVTRRALALSG